MKNRVYAVDMMRGIVMVVMTIDHLVHCCPFIKAPLSDPIDIINTPALLAILRWMGHLCAPTFVLLCGISVYLKQHLASLDRADVSRAIFKRGIHLVLMEMTIITFGWTFSLYPYKIFLQVIFAIGISLMALAVMIMCIGTAIGIAVCSMMLILCDNVLTYLHIMPPQGLWLYLWAILHQKTIFWFFDNSLMVRTTYPVLSWIGLMGIGYAMGTQYIGKITTRSTINTTSAAILMIIMMIILRATTSFGEPSSHMSYINFFDNLLSFANFTKYPPSLLFLMTFSSLTIIIMNAIIVTGARSKTLEFLGRHALAYYVIHVYLITALYHTIQYISKIAQ